MSILDQLRSRSPEAQLAAIRHLLRRGRSLTTEECNAIDGLVRHGPPWERDLMLLVTTHPCRELQEAYRALLGSGDVAAQDIALQHLRQWIRTSSEGFAETIAPLVDSLLVSESPWIAFLAALQAARFFGGGEEAWIRAARAIITGDAQGFPHGIRSQAVEILSEDEQRQLNTQLQRLGARPLGPPPPPPWVRRK